ncbi:exocyst complex component 3-like protein isoform X1 [Alosa sapidissima]|uniref:exocyst complex component 3-like protein isoform X1 n=1 Tax=Alosa sapidissima TaxID=34773 RepID=UPI001C09B3AD|nr:exocyst complex component 3-like protein isoform X1 [Alosa sapidissima]
MLKSRKVSLWPRRSGKEGREPLVREKSLVMKGSPSLRESSAQRPLPSDKQATSGPDDLSDEEWNRRVLAVLGEFLSSPGVDSLSVRDLLWEWRRGQVEQRWGSALWLGQFQQRVQQSVELHFPSLPAEVSATQQPPQPSAYLRQVQEVVQGELLRLAPVLKEAGLLGTVIDRYHTHTVGQLELLLQKNLNADQTFTVLEWTLHSYLSDSMLRHPELAADVQVAADLLLLTNWIQKAKTKLLSVAQGYVAGCLQRILEMEEEEAESRDYSDEEAFIRLPLDITQCLRSVARRAKSVSRSLLGDIQRISLSELHTFLLRFTALERKRTGNGEGGVSHLFRTINTCRELRLLAVQLASEAQTDAASPAAVNLLEELEAQATKQLLHTVTHNTEVCLRSYFRGNTHLQQLLSELKSQLKNLPTECDTHKVVMDAVYSQIVSLYLQQLLLSNRTDLEKMWSEVGVVIREDAEEMQEVFSQQNVNVEKKNELLLKVADIVSCEDVDALKISCLQLSTDYPDVSKKQLKKLLQWRGGLSSQKVKAVMEMSHQGNSLASWMPLPGIVDAIARRFH